MYQGQVGSSSRELQNACPLDATHGGVTWVQKVPKGKGNFWLENASSGGHAAFEGTVHMPWSCGCPSPYFLTLSPGNPVASPSSPKQLEKRTSLSNQVNWEEVRTRDKAKQRWEDKRGSQ